MIGEAKEKKIITITTNRFMIIEMIKVEKNSKYSQYIREEKRYERRGKGKKHKKRWDRRATRRIKMIRR